MEVLIKRLETLQLIKFYATGLIPYSLKKKKTEIETKNMNKDQRPKAWNELRYKSQSDI